MSADSIEKIADLLPCPFCGAAPLKTTTHRVFCANATCCLASKDWDCWPDQWNRRALPSAELERDAARYRWLRDEAPYRPSTFPAIRHGPGYDAKLLMHDAADKVIDAARANEAPR